MEIEKLDTKEKLEYIFREYNDIVYRSILFKVNMRKELAEDLASETYIRAWKYRETYNHKKSHIKTWLMRIAHNLCMDSFKNQKHAFLDLHELIEHIKSDEDIELNLEKDFMFKQIIDGLNLLSPKDQELITLRFIENLELKEIAQIVGKNYYVVKVAIGRAFKKLNNNLKNEK